MEVRLPPGVVFSDELSGIYREPRYFVAGLQGGQNWWLTSFEKSLISVEISIRGLSSDTAFWVMIFNRTDLEADFKKQQKELEKDAL